MGLFSFVAAASMLFPISALAVPFLRTAVDRSPLEYDYSSVLGTPNVSDIIHFVDPGIKSYWGASFLEATDGNQYCLVTTTTNAGSHQLTSISLSDITNGHTFGGSWPFEGQMSSTELYGSTPYLTTGARSADQISELYITGTHPDATFNLTLVPKGPNLYQGVSGAYIWGTGIAFTIDYPETYVTGTLVNFKNETVDIVPERSGTWFDMQWGPSYADQGWFAYVILLDNGVKVQATVLNPTDRYKANSMATIGYPDGHNELHPVVGGLHPRNPWVSKLTNITYYHDTRINIPAKGISLDVHCPLESGETSIHDDPTPTNTIKDGFAWVSGLFEGKPVKGWGIQEERIGADCGMFCEV